MDTTTVVNILLSGILVLGAVAGYRKGLVEQAFELLGGVGTLVIATLAAGGLAHLLEDKLSAPYSMAVVISFAVIVVVGLLVTRAVAVLIGKGVKMTLLKGADGVCGAVLGLIMTMIVASMLITLTLELPLPRSFQRDVARSSMALFLRPVAGQLFDRIVSMAPDEIRFEDYFPRSKTV